MLILKILFRPILFLTLVGLAFGLQAQQTRKEQTSRCYHIEKANTYYYESDPRLEEEFRLALADGKFCPKAFSEIAWHRSRELRFQEAADLFETFVKLTPTKDHREDRNEIRDWRKAARLKALVDASSEPTLNDFTQLLPLVEGYGEHKGKDVLPYVEKGLALYPDSVELILFFANIKIPSMTDKERLQKLLDRAMELAPLKTEVYSARGYFYLWVVTSLPDAEVNFRRALSLSRNTDAGSWRGLGYLYERLGQRNEAILAFSRCLRLLQAKGAPTASGVAYEIYLLRKGDR
jgi:tetratricopeptide (TPR) repeat protein